MSEYPKNVSINLDAKSKFWFVSFISPDGRQKRRSTKVPVEAGMFQGVKLTKSQARNRALLEGQKIAERECSKIQTLSSIPVREFLTGYLERRRHYITHATYVNMSGAYNRLCSFLGKRASAPLYLLTRNDAKKFVEMRRREVRSKSVKKDISSICCAMNDALDSEIIPKNPFLRIVVPPDTNEEKIVHDAFTIDEIRFMISHFPAEWSSAVRCSYETYGQRLGDILSLKWEQFDWNNRIVIITTGKTGRPLLQPMRDEFYNWAKSEFEKRQASPGDLLHPRLFAQRERASISFGNLMREYGIGVLSSKTGGKRRIVNSKTFHSIRATCATVIQSSGISQGMAMQLVGHDSEAIHQGYVRPNLDQLRNAVNALPSINAE